LGWTYFTKTSPESFTSKHNQEWSCGGFDTRLKSIIIIIYIFFCKKYLRYAARCSTEGAEKCAVVVQHADKHILSGAVCEQKQCASDISDTNCA